MMDYTAGSSGHIVSESPPAANQNPAHTANSIRARTHTATAAGVGMNITTGGPHILLFERDQQLVALLSSELQLAGYECHTARTAVEVFDAIARYPVRLVLVNLAQAAAARREFWVALDTQRRGRGVQVLTFHCTNLAGYGPSIDDVEERSHPVIADMEVDGMLGIMNMVNAIRSRLAVSNTSAISRLAAYTSSPPPIGGQATVPLPSMAINTINQTSKGASPSTGGINPPSTPAAPAQPPIPSSSTPASSSSPTELSRTAISNQTDKIRAVIYPHQRSWSTTPVRENNAGSGQNPPPIAKEQQPVQEVSWSSHGLPNANRSAPSADSASTPLNSSPLADSANNGQGRRAMSEAPLANESGLAQLSRMVQEHRHPQPEETASAFAQGQANQFSENTSLQQRLRPDDAPPISSMSLRASPIQDLPTDRISVGQSDILSQVNMKRSDETARQHYTQTPTLMSIAAPASPAPTAPPTSIQAPAPSPLPSPRLMDEAVNQNPVGTPYRSQFTMQEESSVEEHFNNRAGEEHDKDDNDSTLIEPTQSLASASTSSQESVRQAPDNSLLLDIVQSLPVMPSPQPRQQVQPQVHNGRATRSLGSVLLEGHLVPQNRLEVAQNIQRMLRGVDLNYQLGEILLMFKLLTPDQLLAASLVSYGLITTTQISALGRIRQELHSIGLEYDLENLLILFRILTSEQLREIRNSW